MLVKKYSNRRLYDTEDSRYITLDELAEKIRKGSDVQVIDAKSGRDLTQGTLTQIILEGRTARLLPVPLLTQLIRMHDDALADFFGRYVLLALETYNQARSGVQQVSPYFPFAQMPMQAADAFFRMFGGAAMPRPPTSPARSAPPPDDEPPPDDDEPAATSPADGTGEVAALRRELDELKQFIRQVARPPGGDEG